MKQTTNLTLFNLNRKQKPSCYLTRVVVLLLTLGITVSSVNSQSRGNAQRRGGRINDLPTSSGSQRHETPPSRVEQKVETSEQEENPSEWRTYSAPGEYFTVYHKSQDRKSWCGPTVNIIITARNRSFYEAQPEELQSKLTAGWGLSQILCQGIASVSRVNVRMLTEDWKEVRRGWLERSNKFGRACDFHEEFSETAFPNPSNERLDTSGLTYQPFLDNIFFGRFDRAKVEDTRKALFAVVYVYFLKAYGEMRKESLKPPLEVVEHTLETSRNGIVVDRKLTYWTVEKRFEPHLSDYLKNYSMGVFGRSQLIQELTTVISRHKGDSPAIRQFLDNLLRYADDQLSIQQNLLTPSITQENKISISTTPSSASGSKPVPIPPLPEGPSNYSKPAPPAKTATSTPNNGHLTIQVASFSDQAQANARVAQLAPKVEAKIQKAEVGGKTWYRVQIGDFKSRDEANNFAKQLKADGILQDFIVTTK